MQAQILIDYPTSLPDALQTSPAEFANEAKMAMAVKLFEMKRISSGMAAQLAGIDRVTFLLNLHRYNVAMIDIEEDELSSDLENA
jgi:predicted HTH domain antitoxin